MQVRRFEDAEVFYEQVLPYLITVEARNNLIFGVLNAIRTGRYTDDLYMAVVEHDGQAQLVALRTPPHNLLLATTNQIDASRPLADDVINRYGTLPGAQGPLHIIRPFVSHWQALTGQIATVQKALRAFQLTQVRPPSLVPGTIRPIDASDRRMLYKWHYQATIDMFGAGNQEESRKAIDHFLQHPSPTRQLFLWCVDNIPVSMTAMIGDTPNGIRIALVYTPPEYRRQGYASALVAAVSQLVLDSGRQYCFLFTDLANPTSNHIYQTIGYEPVEDFEMYQFESPARATDQERKSGE